MKMSKTFLLTVILTVALSINIHSVFAASPKVTISYEPASPNFTSGQQNVVTAVVQPVSGNISAATLTLQATGGVKIVNVLDGLDGSNNPLTSSKYILQDVSERSTKITILFMKATADLPTLIKIPVIVTGAKAGNLQIDTKESQINDGNGNSYTLSQPKASYITFSDTGKDTLLPPTPTPLPATSMNVTVTMKFQGIQPADVKTKTISGVKVQLVQGTQSSLPQFISVTMDDAGLWHGSAVFPNVKRGDGYALLIKGPKHLQEKIKLDTENAVGINASGVTLMIGDVGIQDGILNSYDLSFIQNTIRKTSKNALSDADVNYDGKVNKTDYELVVYSLKNMSGLDQR